MMYFQSYWFQLKNGTPVIWKRFSFSRKIVSKLKYWKRLKFSLIFTWKHADLWNGGLFWKSLVSFFRRTYTLSVGFKIKTPKKTFSNVKTKTNSSFAVKEATIHFYCLFDESCFPGMYDKGIKELIWLCKHMKNVRSSQACLSMIFCTEFGKAQVLSCEHR